MDAVTLFCLNWVYLTVKTTGYSDTPLIATLFTVPKGVTVSEDVCILFSAFEEACIIFDGDCVSS